MFKSRAFPKVLKNFPNKTRLLELSLELLFPITTLRNSKFLNERKRSKLTNSTTSLAVFPLVPPISSRNSFPNSYRTDQNPVYLWPIANFTPIFASLRGCPAGSWHKDNRVLHDNDVIDQTIRGSRCDTGSTVTIKLL